MACAALTHAGQNRLPLAVILLTNGWFLVWDERSREKGSGRCRKLILTGPGERPSPFSKSILSLQDPGNLEVRDMRLRKKFGLLSVRMMGVGVGPRQSRRGPSPFRPPRPLKESAPLR